MILKNAEAFINTYEKFYFENRIDDNEKKKCGVPINLIETNQEVEDWICDNELRKGRFSEYALAWKSGKLKWDDTDPTTEDFKLSDGYLNGRNQYINKEEFDAYCTKLDCVFQSGEKTDNFEDLYKSLYGVSPQHFGPVYIITSVFFKSRGFHPIYDQFVHKAVRALESDVLPSEVYIGVNPNKDEVKQIMTMYNEYKRLLSKVFPFETRINGGPFISRELDRALWVYGHCTEPYGKVIAAADKSMDECAE